MNYLDIIIGIILLLFALGGLRNGIIREAFSLVAFVGGIYGASRLSNYVGEKLATVINVSQQWMSVISFILVFFLLAMIINMLGKLISKLVKSLNLGFIDKLGGFAFGVLKGFVLVGLLILVLDFFGLKDVLNKKTCEESVLYETSEKVAAWITDHKDFVIEKFDEEKEKAEDIIKVKSL